MRPRLAAIGLALAACSGTAARGDADADDGGVDAAPFVPTPPTPAELPRFVPCPDGWREVPDRDLPELVTCDPWPAGGPQDCAPHEAHFPGGPGCERIGPPCPAGDYSDEIPDGAEVVHVRAGADPGGDGTVARPFASIQDGIAAVPGGGIVAVSRGRFEESVVISRPMTVLGACVEATEIASPDPSEPSVDVGLRGGVTLRGIGVTGSGIAVHGSDPTTLDGVIVHSVRHNGIEVAGKTTLVARDLAVRDAGTERAAWKGIVVVSAARVELERAVLEGNHVGAIQVTGDLASLVASDLAVRDTQTDGSQGIGLMVNFFGRAELRRTAFDANHSTAIFVDLYRSELVAEDLLVHGTRVGPIGVGFGLQVTSGARAELSRAQFSENAASGVHVRELGSTLLATDLASVDTLPRTDDRVGFGIDVGDGARADLVRAAFARNHTAGVVVFGAADLRADDLSIVETRSQERDGRQGDGLEVDTAGRAWVERGLLAANRRLAVSAIGAGTRAWLRDVVVEATIESACAADGCEGGGGTGLGAFGGAAVLAGRFRSSDNALCGVQVGVGSELDLSDGEVSGNAIGANVAAKDFDLGRLQESVLYVGNDRTLDSRALPVPDAVARAEP